MLLNTETSFSKSKINISYDKRNKKSPRVSLVSGDRLKVGGECMTVEGGFQRILSAASSSLPDVYLDS